MPRQTVFRTDYDVGYPGMVANGETSNRFTATIEDADGIPFGRAAFRGAGDHGCVKAPVAGAFLGIAMTDKGVVLLPGAAVDTFPQRSNVPLFQRGSIWIRNGAAAVADGDQVYVTPAGAYTNLPAAGANIILPGWVFQDTAPAAGMARITNNRGAVV